MLLRLVMMVVLLSLCVGVHALVISTLLFRLSRATGPTLVRFWHADWLLIRVALWIVAAHLLEIGIWAAFLAWQKVFPDIKTSFYFSAVTTPQSVMATSFCLRNGGCSRGWKV